MAQATCYDAVNPLNIDPNVAPVVAGYGNGRVSVWPASGWMRFPNARQVVIDAINEGIGDMLDVENGDATPADVPGWVTKRRAAGHTWPTVYCSKDTLPAVAAACKAAGVALPFLFGADWGPAVGQGTPHVLDGCVATQYDHDLPPGYDTSLVADLDVWPPVAPGVRGTTPPAEPVALPPVPAPPAAPPPAAPAPHPTAPPFPGVDLVYVPGRPLMHDAECQQWQARMIARGWNLGHTGADGFYGPVTEGACLHFQEQKGLRVDGIVGPQTWAAAWELPVTPN